MLKRLCALMSLLLIVSLTTLIVEAADRNATEIVKEAKAAIREISPTDVKAMIDDKQSVVILDVRDREEFETGYIPGAINISRGTLEFKAPVMLPDKGAIVVVYCGIDLRSPLATKTLNDLGYKNALNMTGGLQVWKEKGYPIRKP